MEFKVNMVIKFKRISHNHFHSILISILVPPGPKILAITPWCMFEKERLQPNEEVIEGQV